MAVVVDARPCNSKFQNRCYDRRCGGCSAALVSARYAYHCQSCGDFACKLCTNASRGSSVPMLAPRPQPACGGCQGVLVGIKIHRASVNRPCHSCSVAFEYLNRAYHCDSCTSITCKQCTWDRRRRRSGARHWSSPVRGLKGRHRLSCSCNPPPQAAVVVASGWHSGE